jgi:phosphate starvation-inducible PhoH-like protein
LYQVGDRVRGAYNSLVCKGLLRSLSIQLPEDVDPVVLLGPSERYVKLIRRELEIEINARGRAVCSAGSKQEVSRAASMIDSLIEAAQGRRMMSDRELMDQIKRSATDGFSPSGSSRVYTDKTIRPMTRGQESYLATIQSHDLVFCSGPAGSGKTYLAVAAAASMLKAGVVRRLVLARPAVEAGEKLGFLPGDLQEKVNPYLRPLLDALYDMIDFDQVQRFMESNVIEIVPLAFMRGRTLNDSAIILDEAQNTAPGQMLMFLTRMGYGVQGDCDRRHLSDRSGAREPVRTGGCGQTPEPRQRGRICDPRGARYCQT